MAAVNNVVLTIAPGSTGATKKVTVSYLLSFDAAEVGRPFDVRVDLLGEDNAGDDEAPSGQSKPVFSFGFPFFITKTVIGSGHPAPFSDSSEVSGAALNEDPGTTPFHPDVNTTLNLPHSDEIFARVTVATKPVTARSDTKSGFFF